MIRCTFCRFAVNATDDQVTCSTCEQAYHRQCWESNGGCATFGCEHSSVGEKPAAAPVKRGWGDEKTCPACFAEIPSSSMQCRYCKAKFPYADPMIADEYRAWQDAEKVRRAHRRVLLGLFGAALLAVPGPIVAPAASYLTRRWQEEFVGEYAAFFALGYGTAAIGGLYSVFMLLLYLGR